MRVNEDRKYLIWGLAMVALVALMITVLFWRKPETAKGAASSVALSAALATTSTLQMGPSNMVMLFASSTPSCTTRVVSTGYKAAMISFSTSTMSSTVAIGNFQAASTTVAYDSGLFGCGAWGVISYDSSTTITVSEFR